MLQKTSTGGWKLLVPEAQVLDEGVATPLQAAAEGDPYVLRIRELQLARPWMERLAHRERLVIDIEEWVNKTSGRGMISLGVDNEDGNDPEELVRWHIMLGLASYAEVVPRLFAWADVSMHEETYGDAEHDKYEAEYVIFDSEEDNFDIEHLSDWRRFRVAERLRPYAHGAGEVDSWRLELRLNELGNAFLVVDKFGMEGGRQLVH